MVHIPKPTVQHFNQNHYRLPVRTDWYSEILSHSADIKVNLIYAHNKYERHLSVTMFTQLRQWKHLSNIYISCELIDLQQHSFSIRVCKVNCWVPAKHAWSTTRWGNQLRDCVTSWEDAGSIPHYTIILPAALWLLNRLTRRQKWVTEIFTEGKGGRCIQLLNLPFL